MSKDWIETLESHSPPQVERAIKSSQKAIHDLSLHVHLSHWHPISTAPCNQELELRIAQAGELLVLEFPCLQTNDRQWINVDLGSEIIIHPVEWRVWQRDKSPQPHHLKIQPKDHSDVFHHDLVSTEQSANNKNEE